MRTYILLAIFIFGSISLSAQCNDYQSEMQNVETYINTAMQDLKKVEKADTLEQAQKLIDKAVIQIELAIKSANLAKEYAAYCSCTEGINSATITYDATFDCKVQVQKAANNGIIKDLKVLVKKALSTARSAKNETVDGTSYCLE
jgi:hypothetical protein